MHLMRLILLSSILVDIIGVYFLFTMIDDIGIGMVLFISAILFGGTYYIYRILKKAGKV